MRIAITGGIAEGKSTILSWLFEAGYPVFSSDRIVEAIWARPDTPELLRKAIGWAQPPTRADLREAITKDHGLRARLNEFMHHRVLRAMEAEPQGFFEVPLLVEACLMFRFDAVWVMTCEPETQIQRLTQRLGDEQLARELIATQLNSRVKRTFADFELSTDRKMDELRPLVLAAAAGAFPTT